MGSAQDPGCDLPRGQLPDPSLAINSFKSLKVFIFDLTGTQKCMPQDCHQKAILRLAIYFFLLTPFRILKVTLSCIRLWWLFGPKFGILELSILLPLSMVAKSVKRFVIGGNALSSHAEGNGTINRGARGKKRRL